jgi:predicted unusual protein kinase regulating ubiquinone biosynthesis (AarF/ABC1/UbiB family)
MEKQRTMKKRWVLDQATRHAIEETWAVFGNIPTDLLLVGRALGLIDGITKQLDPSMDTIEIVAHYAE